MEKLKNPELKIGRVPDDDPFSIKYETECQASYIFSEVHNKHKDGENRNLFIFIGKTSTFLKPLIPFHSQT